LSEDQDKKVIFDHQPTDLCRMLLGEWPQVEEDYFFALNTSNRYLMIAPSQAVTAYGEVWAAAAAAQDAAFYDGDGGRLKTIAAANPSNTQIHVCGWFPHGVFLIPFGDQNDPDDWFDVTAIKSLRADVNVAAAATGGLQIFLEQLRSY
jgi:hypothetical protein